MNHMLPRARLTAFALKALFVAAALFTAPNAAFAGHKLTTIYTFPCTGGCAQGASPRNTLVADSAGNLYGTTVFAGAGSSGTAFEMVKTAHGYKFQKLYDFCANVNCTDGGQPGTSLIVDADGNLYGVTSSGGANGGGNVYKLVRGKHHAPWTIETLYDFCSESCVSGASPIGGLSYQGQQAGLPYDGTSPLFGATYFGGAAGQGAIYRLAFSTRTSQPTQSVIYSFCARKNCKDGEQPSGPPVIDASGHLFGATSGGGVGAGVIYELAPVNQNYTQTLLGTFCDAGFACVQQPNGRLTMDGQGNLFGVAMFGSESGSEGALFEVSPNGSAWSGTVLHNFCVGDPNCNDGIFPTGEVAVAANGAIFGTASNGGAGHFGTLFSYSNGVFRVLHAFCTDGLNTCTDGYSPNAGVILDGSGVLLGATGGGFGGPADGGTVFAVKTGKVTGIALEDTF